MKLKTIGCQCDCGPEVDGMHTGMTLENGFKITKMNTLKNGQVRIEAEKWYDSGSDYKDDELLKRVYHTTYDLTKQI